MLNHIALTINSFSEIKNFYQDILEMEIVKEFSINKQISKSIFGLKNTDVYMLKKNNLILELFVKRCQLKNKYYNHICINVNSKEKLIKKAKIKNYSNITINSDKYNIEFIKDKSGNLFELKEI